MTEPSNIYKQEIFICLFTLVLHSVPLASADVWGLVLQLNWWVCWVGGSVKRVHTSVAAGLSQQLLVLQSSSQGASHVSGGVLHVSSCADGSVQRAVQGALLVNRQGASRPSPHLLGTPDTWRWASAVGRRHVEGGGVQPKETLRRILAVSILLSLLLLFYLEMTTTGQDVGAREVWGWIWQRTWEH